MKRKCCSIIACVMVTLCFAACGKETDEKVNSVSDEILSEEQSVVASVEDVVDDTDGIPYVLINEVKVFAGDDMAVLEKKLGDPDTYGAAQSCTGKGEDKCYGYGDINIYTQPVEAKDVIFLIEIQENGKLSTGLGIGDNKNDIIQIYGGDYTEEDDTITYIFDGTTLCFEMSEDVIDMIEIIIEE